VAISKKKVTFDLNEGNEPKRVHRAVLAKFSVQDLGNIGEIELGRSRDGAFEQTNFLFVPFAATSAVFARRVENPAAPLEIEVEFEIRTRGSALTAPRQV
jgi:hypothetical protein